MGVPHVLDDFQLRDLPIWILPEPASVAAGAGGFGCSQAAVISPSASRLALGFAEKPVRMIERDSRDAEEEHDAKAEHRQIDVQPAHQLGEADAEPAPEGTSGRLRGHA